MTLTLAGNWTNKIIICLYVEIGRLGLKPVVRGYDFRDDFRDSYARRGERGQV